MDRIAFRPEEVAELTGLGRTTVYEELRSGNLESTKVGRARVITRDAVDRWLNRRTADAGGKQETA